MARTGLERPRSGAAGGVERARPCPALGWDISRRAGVRDGSCSALPWRGLVGHRPNPPGTGPTYQAPAPTRAGTLRAALLQGSLDAGPDPSALDGDCVSA